MKRFAASALFALVAFPAPMFAQGGTCDFTVDMALSSLSFSGTTSLGPIVGDPATVALSGTVDADLATEGNPASTGQVAGGDVLLEEVALAVMIDHHVTGAPLLQRAVRLQRGVLR